MTSHQIPKAALENSISADSLQTLPLTAVTISDRFWSRRMTVNRENTLPIEYEQCKTTGRVDAFKLDWKPGEPKPHYFWDSDIAKWIEAVSFSLASFPDPALESQLDDVIELIRKAQQPDGYVNIYFTAVEPENRWKNLRDHHELYCAGHLMEAAAAHYEATGKRSLLDIMARYTDYIAQVFGKNEGQIPGYCGHEEIELALVKMYRVTGEPKYLKLSSYFVDERGQQPHYFDTEARMRGEDPGGFHFENYQYNQGHVPVREQSEVTGHAVRGMYLYSAMADLARELGDKELRAACERIWSHLISKQLYVTGGIGSSNSNEGYTFDYDLPNETAYAETCASIGLVFWAQRMLQIDCDSRYANLMERALYNGVISGVSLDGRRFFYENPLASVGKHHRKDWFGCACCPPNLARLVASLGSYIYSYNANTIAVHLYVQGRAQFSIASQTVTLSQTTDMPWEGNVKLSVETASPVHFALKLRLPDWSPKTKVRVNGEAIDPSNVRGYLSVDRVWSHGDTVEMDLDMSVRRIYANPNVRMDNGRIALQRGPVVYCLEEIDNVANLDSISISRTSQINASFDSELLDGVVVLSGEGSLAESDGWGEYLYKNIPPDSSPYQYRAVPYYAWDNRTVGRMSVWIREN